MMHALRLASTHTSHPTSQVIMMYKLFNYIPFSNSAEGAAHIELMGIPNQVNTRKRSREPSSSSSSSSVH